MAVAPLAPSWETIDPFIEAYEKCLGGHPGIDVPLSSFLPSPDHPHYLMVLRELVRVDLEHRWTDTTPPGSPRRVEDYLATFPILRADSAGVGDIAFEEYRLRRQAGEEPSPDEYHRRFGIDTTGWPTDRPEPVHGIERAARVYLARHGDGDATPLAHDASADGFPDSESVQVLADLHHADPKASYRLAQALTSLPSPTQEFLGFQLVRELGRGAFGRVYLARQGDLANRFVALKVGADLRGESHFLARLQHTNIVPVYSAHRSTPFQALCMPYFGPTTLAHVLRELHPLPHPPRSGRWLAGVLASRRDAAAANPGGPTMLTPLEQWSYVDAVLWLSARLADGLAHAHEHGILHQDLKPANVLLADDGQPMLLDFSLSQDTRLIASLSAAFVGGTMPYMAPEHLAAFRDGRRHADVRSDVYALGLILFELLAGRPAFPIPQGSLTDTLPRMIGDRTARPPDLRRFNPGVSPAVASIVQHCLSPDPTRRYQSARQLHEDLELHLGNRPLRWAREPSLWERSRKWARRHPRLTSGYVVGGFALVVVLVLGLMFILRGQQLAQTEKARDEEVARRAAAETHRRFTDELRRARFLLGGPSPNRRDVVWGVAHARQGLERYGVLAAVDWESIPSVTLLPTAERERLPGDVRELLLLLGRGERLLGGGATEDLRAERLREAVRLNELAATCPAGEEGLRAVLLQRVVLLFLEGRESAATDLFEQAKAGRLLTARDAYLTAMEQMSRGEFRTARAHLLRARQLDPQDAFVWFALGLCHAEMKEYPRAAEALTASIALWPDFPVAHYQRARIHNEMKEHAEAVAEFTEVIRLEPDYLDAYVDRGFARAGLKDYRGAEADFTHALEAEKSTSVFPTPTRVYFFRANVRRLAGDEPGARRDEDEGLKRKPRDELSWVARGLTHQDRGDVEAALADFDSALQLNPRCVAALEDRAALLAERPGGTTAAIKALDAVIEIAPTYGQALAGRAVLLARLGQRDEALRDAREAERVDPQPAVLYQAAGAYALTSRHHPQDRKEAFRLLAAAFRGGYGYALLRQDPDLEPIRSDPEFRRLLGSAEVLQPPGPRAP
jgi:serine/threonine protein kinase/tetratricopeptide (TPR) repeat protein